MWPSEELASRLYDIANWGLLGSLVVGVISTGLVVWMGNAKETYLRKSLSDTTAEAAGARVSASDALLEQEKLKERNLVLQKQLLKLRSETEARRLTGTQKENLTKLLSKEHGGIVIVSPMADPEASDFADDFDSALRAARWNTLRVTNRISNKFGVAIITVDGTNRVDAKWLSNGLSAMGIRYDTVVFKADDEKSLHSISPYFEIGYVYLVVEHKPLPTNEQ